MLTPLFESIPEFLRNEPYWCVWGYLQRNGKMTKPPLQTNGQFARSNDTSTWDNYANACEYFKSMQGQTLRVINAPLAGVGVLFHNASSIVGIDIDHAINPDGTFETWAEPLITELMAITYCELSPSGTGIHAYLCGQKPDEKCKGGPDNNLEVYEAGRYFTVTGYKLDGSQETAASGAEAQAMINKLVAYIRGNQERISTGGETEKRKPLQSELRELVDKSGPEWLTDSELIVKARQAKRGMTKFSALYDSGDITGYPSASEADQALCNMLAFWTAKDAARMDRLMRQSALLQEPARLAKWDKVHSQGATYGQITIATAIRDCVKTYGESLPGAGKKQTRNFKNIPDNGKPKIIYQEGELTRIIGELDRAINGSAYRYNNLVVEITRLPEARSYRGLRKAKGASIISQLDVHSLAVITDQCATWVKLRQRSNQIEEYLINPPDYIMRKYLAAKNSWTLPILTGLVNCPILRMDGSLLDKPGWDSITGLYADFKADSFPPVSAAPSKQAALDSLNIIKSAINEFPFKTDVDQSVALAAMLTTVLRPSVKHAPLFGFSAPCPGTGKSTLADLIGIIATGKSCAAMDFNKDEAEFKKALFATILEGTPITLIDNVVGELNSSALNIILTQETFQGRVLGLSHNERISFCSIWLATGNNLTICGDLTRRTLICTLDADTERPAERKFERDIYQWAVDYRGDLVNAALTILRAYYVAGKPLPDGVKPMNGFDDWSHWVRGALLWLGEADPKDSQVEIEAHDPERESLRTVLHAWHEHFGSDFVTTKDLLKREAPDGGLIPDTQVALSQALLDAIPHGRELTGKQLGKWLARHNGRVLDGLKLINTGQKDGDRSYWKVIQA